MWVQICLRHYLSVIRPWKSSPPFQSWNSQRIKSHWLASGLSEDFLNIELAYEHLYGKKNFDKSMQSCKAFSVMHMSKQWFEYVKEKLLPFLFYFCWCFVCKWWRGGGIKRHEYEKGFSSIYSDQERAAVDQSIFIVMSVHCSEARRGFNPRG